MAPAIFRNPSEKQAPEKTADPLAPLAPGGGNTNSPPETDKRPSGAKRWVFVWNNYPSDWVARLAPTLECCQWIGGYEVGKNGTPHIQGYVEFPIKVRPIGYRGAPKEIHWGDKNGRPCYGTRAHNLWYCTKEGKGYEGTLKPPRPLPNVELSGWHMEAKEKFEREPDGRTIFWYWSEQGKRGKSTMVRWLVRQGALICSGKASDMKYMIVKYYEKHGDYPECIVFDVPRSMEKYLSYTGMEEIINGVFASTKYECEPVEMPYVNMFVFANFPPDLNDVDMSSDRFEVVNVDKKEEKKPKLPWDKTNLELSLGI